MATAKFNDDRALIGGTAFFEGRSVMIIAQQKGRGHQGKHHPQLRHAAAEGYRKALRLMKLAEKFGLPVISFIRHPRRLSGRRVRGAPRLGGHRRQPARDGHASGAVHRHHRREGGSGGALGIGVTDRVLIFENSYYSVISPEGCAAILWKDRANAPKAAEGPQAQRVRPA